MSLKVRLFRSDRSCLLPEVNEEAVTEPEYAVEAKAPFTVRDF